MSTPLDHGDIQEVTSLLSPERLSTFVKITGSDRDAIDLHRQSLLVAAALMPVTAMIEIVLRNAVCECLRETFGTPDWLTNPPAPFKWKGEEIDNIRRCGGWARRAAYSKYSQSDKRALDGKAFPAGVPVGTSHEARSKARQKAVEITNGQLIAQLTLFFWKRVFSSDYEDTLWKRSLRSQFPNKTISRSQIANHLEVIYQARNRIAHHEPVIGERLRRVVESTAFITTNFRSKMASEDAILAKMTALYRDELAAQASMIDRMLERFIIKDTAPI